MRLTWFTVSSSVKWCDTRCCAVNLYTKIATYLPFSLFHRYPTHLHRKPAPSPQQLPLLTPLLQKMPELADSGAEKRVGPSPTALTNPHWLRVQKNGGMSSLTCTRLGPRLRPLLGSAALLSPCSDKSLETNTDVSTLT